MVAEVLIALSVTFIAGFLPGCVPLWIGRGYGETVMRSLTGIAAGFLLAAALLGAVPEGFELVFHELESDLHSSESSRFVHALEIAGPGVIVLAGFLLMMIFESLGIGHAIHEEYHNHQRDYGHVHVHHPLRFSGGVAFGLTLHALTDGLAIGASLATGESGISMPLLVGVITHKMPAAFSLAAFGMHELRRPGVVFRYLVIFALATPVAMYAAWYGFASVSEIWVGVALLFSAGTFVYVATVDLLPNVHNSSGGRTVLWQIVLAAVAMAVLLYILKAFGFIEHLH